MVAALEARLVAPGIYRWSAFSPEHKVELTSHSVFHDGTMLVFDPIPVSAEILDWFPEPVAPSAIVLTSGNHSRAAHEWQARFSCPIWGPAEAFAESAEVRDWKHSTWPFRDWIPFPLPGGGPGETAFYLPCRRLAVFGDALVNLPGRGLEILPDKYCSSSRDLRGAVRHFTQAHEIYTALFAHGMPLLENAGISIRQAVQTGPSSKDQCQ